MENNEKTGSVYIPSHIMERQDLSLVEKVLYGKIVGLTEKEGFCFASNEWLSQQIGLSYSGVSNAISKFVKLELLKREIIRNENKEIIKRKLYTFQTPNLPPITPRSDTLSLPEVIPITPRSEESIEYSKRKEVLRNTSKEKENTFVEEANKILLHWNTLYHTRYKTPKALLGNLAYWRESYSLDDILKAVTNIQYDEYWKDKMTPVILLRRKNPRGEEVDNIGNMLNLASPEPLFTEEELDGLKKASDYLKNKGLL